MNFEKFSSGQRSVLRHIDRENPRYSNENVRPELSGENIRLSPDRDLSSEKYWKEVLENDVHVTRRSGRNATVDLVSITVSLPEELKDSPKELQEEFFRDTYDFILDRHYGAGSFPENDCHHFVVSAEVHYDEITKEGQSTPHLHAAMIPAVREEKYAEGWKCSCRDWMDRKNLYHWHDDFQDYIDSHFNERNGLEVRVKTGKTDGKNYSIDYYKAHRREIQNERDLTQDIKNREIERDKLQREIEQLQEQKKTLSWGSSSGWGKDRELEWGRN